MRSDVQEPIWWLDGAVGSLCQEETSLLVGCAWMSLSGDGDGYPLPTSDGSSHGEERFPKGPHTSNWHLEKNMETLNAQVTIVLALLILMK